MEREELENTALDTVSSDYYYELSDNINNATDEELQLLIDCNGDEELEYELELNLNNNFKR